MESGCREVGIVEAEGVYIARILNQVPPRFYCSGPRVNGQ